MQNTVQTVIKVQSAEAISKFNNLGSTIRNNVALGTLMGEAISKGIGVAVGGLNGLIGKFSEAADIQMENIALAGDLSKLSGLAFKDSGVFVDEFTQRMSKAAATLPGATADFVNMGKSLMDELIPSFQDANGELDKIAMNKALDKLSIAGGMRAVSSGVTTAESGRAIAKLLGGQSTLAELSRLDFFEKNKAVLATLRTDLEAQGKELKDLSSKEILALAQNAIGVSDDVIDAASNSTSGIIAGFQSALFDPNTGTFGILRKLSDGSSVFGENGVIGKASGILSAMGLTADPMEALASGLEWINGWIKKAGFFLNSIKAKIDINGEESVPTLDLSALGGKIGQWLGTMYNNMLSAMDNIDWLAVANMVGEGIAGAINLLANFLRTVDFAKIAGLFLKAGVAATMAVGVALTNIDWASVGIVLLKAGAVAIAAFGVSIAGAIAGFGLAGIAAFSSLALGITAVIGKIRDYFLGRGDTIKDAINGLFADIAGMFAALRERVANFFAGQKFDSATAGRTGRRVANNATGFDPMGILAAAARERSAMPSGANVTLANSTEGIYTTRQQQGILAALNGRRGGGGLNVQNINIQGGSNVSPEELVKRMLKALDREWNSYQESQFAPNY